ncbi:hypothetical protein LG651_11640 [Tamlana sp. 62-3]|uniref:Uncharacterized protein n=1 Tax=Neotamlana sargassicola TaxID=2883125 RepID=A0A9X1I6T8_9FLAO|nr:hypothetical protein [Tamlana sargassicola]MCB4808905.1 hypothetical protein [Tamlana sargassicola]
MKINWLPNVSFNENDLRNKLEIEYEFRKKMTKFLIENQIEACCADYNCLVFNFYVSKSYFEISPETPEPLYSSVLFYWKNISLNEVG